MSAKKTRIVYIEDKSSGLEGAARIGRVVYSKSGKSLFYKGREFIPIQGFKSNYLDVEAQSEFWISGPKKRGGDRLYGTGLVEIDDDVRAEYWTKIRGRPEFSAKKNYRD